MVETKLKAEALGRNFLLLAFCISLAILLTKNSFNSILFPVLSNEDASEQFSLFYNDHSIKNIFRYYAGYIQVFPNLLSYFITFLPVNLIPYLYAITAYGITALTYTLFCGLIYNAFHNKYLALYVVVMISLLPLSNFAIIGSITYQIWNGLILLLLLFLLPKPKIIALRLPYVVFIVILIWSHPISIIFTPLWVMDLFLKDKNKVENGIFILAAMLYFFYGKISVGSVSLQYEYFFNLFAERVVVESIIGPLNRLFLIESYGHSALAILFALICLPVFSQLYISWKKMGSEGRRVIVVLIYVMVSIFSATIIGRGLGSEYYEGSWAHRYTYVPKIIFIVICLISSFHFLKNSVRYRYYHFIIFALIVVLSLNSKLYYFTSPSVGKQLVEFVNSVPSKQVVCENGEKKYMTLTRGTDLWEIKLDICQR